MGEGDDAIEACGYLLQSHSVEWLNVGRQHSLHRCTAVERYNSLVIFAKKPRPRV